MTVLDTSQQHWNTTPERLIHTSCHEVAGTPKLAVRIDAAQRVQSEVYDAVAEQGFVVDHADAFATVYTDYAAAYRGLPYRHESVRHSVAEYVRGQAHTNGIESFWAMLKRAHTGTFHKISPKHLDRYVQEFAGKHNVRESGTLEQMREVVSRLMGRSLGYRRLVADNGLPSGAR